jgi:CSLREA domain-containing protein
MKTPGKIDPRALRSACTKRPGLLGLALLVAVLSLAALTVGVSRAQAATFTVNTADDVNDGACTASHCSLREAINATNVSADTDTITFNIPGPAPHTIGVVGRLPAVRFPVIIDGTTEPGYAGTPIVELDGSLSGGRQAGFDFFGGSSTVRGLVINRFKGPGMFLHDGGNYVIEDNYIGTDLTGTVDLGNGEGGIFVTPRTGNGGNTIARNVISGNGLNGIVLYLDRNVIQGNYIGTDASGTAALGNDRWGIRVVGPANDNLFGGTAAGEGNVISANGDAGIVIHGAAPTALTGNVIQGNYIGTNASGTAALGNRRFGIETRGNSTTIGGTAPGARNIVSGNGWAGIYFVGSTGSVVQGNLIGTAADGTTALGNGFTGPASFGWDSGISTRGDNNTIGGTAPGAANTIAYSAGSGVFIGVGARNGVLSNSIFSNGLLGIDLYQRGVVQPNDPGDADGGPNELQNYPLLTSARGNTVEGTLNSTPNTSFRLEFFANREPDPSGHGEGERFLGSMQVTTDGSGNASFTFVSPTPVFTGEFVSSTATDPANNTSEFSRVVLVEPGPPPPPPGDEVLNHFSCYTLVKTPAVDARVDLTDQFGTHRRRVRHADFLCNPVTKEIGGEVTPPVNPDAHLKCYRIVPPEEPKPTRLVEVRNQLTPAGQVIQVHSTREVCAPATKDRPDLDPAQLGLDHFTCYSAEGPSVKKQALLSDQFLSSRSVLISKAQLLCNPTEKRRDDRPGEVVTPLFPDRHLVCYRVEPNPSVNRTVHTEDQFRVEDTTALVLKYLCVPSERRPV